jgi:hypothetical protein
LPPTESLALVGERLAQNRRLQRELAQGMERVEERLVVPFDSTRLCRLFEFIARGLITYHWRAPLPPHCRAKAVILTADGRALFDRLISAAGSHIANDLSAGTFTYRGLRDAITPEHTVWQFTAFGGLRFSDADNLPTRIGVLTGSPDFLTLLPE